MKQPSPREITVQTLLDGDVVEYLKLRSSTPESTLPMVDDRSGEHPADIFVQLCKDAPSLRERLANAVSQVLDADETDLCLLDSCNYILGTSIATYSSAVASLRSWIDRNWGRALESRGLQRKMATGIEILAVLQTPRSIPFEQYWTTLWARREPLLSGAIFKGIRINNPDLACEVLPDLIARARAAGASAGPLIAELWAEPLGREAMIRWLRSIENASVDSVLLAVRPATRDEIRVALATFTTAPPPEGRPRVFAEGGRTQRHVPFRSQGI